MWRPALLSLGLLAGSALPAAAQSGARVVVPVSPVMLAGGEGESLSCRRQRADEQLDARYPGRGLFDFAIEGARPARWRIVLIESQRTVTVALQRNYVPRAVVVEAGRGAAIAGAHESLRLRFLENGQLQDGAHVVTAATGAAVAAPIDTAAARAVYALARELAYRCDRGLVEPVPLGSTARQIPPD